MRENTVARAVLMAMLAAACGEYPPHKEPSDTDTDAETGWTPPDDTGNSFHDPLSRPAQPTLDLADFTSAETCAGCHPTHYAQWRTSVHATAMHDPVFQGLVGVRQSDLAGTEDAFCTQCHSAIGTRAHDIVPGFSFDELDPLTMEGVTCEGCHKVSAVERTSNAGHRFDPDGPIRGPIEDPIANTFHDSEPVDFLGESEFCGSCHDVIEVSGLPLERPYEEWTTSPARDDGRNCQDCHMPTTEGPAANGGPERTLHNHGFVGVDVPLVEGWLDETELASIRASIDTLLTASGTVLLELPASATAGHTLDVVVTVRNEIDAHNLPTGSTFIRQCWLEVTATDATGRVIYATGDLDENGDLRDRWSALDPYGDDDLVSLGSGFVDDEGVPTLFTHQATEHTSTALQPLHERTVTLFVPVPEDVAGPIDVAARLRFRPLPPFLLRLLELDQWIEQLVITDIDADAGQVLLED